jgi:hypothetical protein
MKDFSLVKRNKFNIKILSSEMIFIASVLIITASIIVFAIISLNMFNPKATEPKTAPDILFATPTPVPSTPKINDPRIKKWILFRFFGDKHR